MTEIFEKKNFPGCLFSARCAFGEKGFPKKKQKKIGEVSTHYREAR
jgi:hypothetical protein